MAFFPLEGPGLTILANHRLVDNVPNFSFDRFLDGARRLFDVTPLDDPHTLRARQPAGSRLGRREGRAVVLRLRDDAFDRIAWPRDTSRAWRELAVSILHEGLLRPLLDITDAKLDAKTHVEYTADQAEAIRLAQDGKCQAAFLIAPTTRRRAPGRRARRRADAAKVDALLSEAAGRARVPSTRRPLTSGAALVRVIGIDLAWGPRNDSGVCAVDDGRVLDSACLRSDDAIVALGRRNGRPMTSWWRSTRR